MMLPSFGILAIASSLLSLTAAHNIQMKAHMRECFHEQLHKDDKMTVTFQVGDREFGGSGNLEIDFWVRQICLKFSPGTVANCMFACSQIEAPSRSYQVHERGVSSGDHSFTALEDGKYTYCFNNEHWGANTKEVSFNVHGIVYVPESEAPQDPLEKEGQSNHDHHLHSRLLIYGSAGDVGAGSTGKGRAGLHRGPGEDTQEHS
jgi:hypothetical protein